MQASDVEAEARRLMASLVTAVPGELGRMVRAIVGVRGHAAGREIEPPARSLGWASRLLALCCQAYGQPVERAVPVGACLELLGIAAVALDVAQDGHNDLLRAYGAQPSCEQPNWGRSAALVSNASVALIALFWQALLEHGPRYGVEPSILLEIGRLIAERLVLICHAQHLDLTASRLSHLSLEDYDRMIEGKTGEIDGLACEAGAVLAGAGGMADRHSWRKLGVERAVAQQLYDDYVDLAEDLTCGGQLNHPVLYGLNVAADKQEETILTLLDMARSGLPGAPHAMQELRAILRELGAEYYTLTCMVVRQKRALAALEDLHIPPEVHDWLYRWVRCADPLYSHASDGQEPDGQEPDSHMPGR